MNRKLAILSGCLAALALSGTAWAQLGGILTAVPRPSAYPADWQNTPTLATMLIVSSTPATCDLEVFLTSDKGQGVSTPKHQFVPQGSTNYYTQHLTNWNLHLTGRLEEGFERTGRLPDGTYVITVHCFNVMSAAGGGTVLCVFSADGGEVTRRQFDAALAAGGSTTLSWPVATPNGKQLSVSATASVADDAQPGNNTATAMTSVGVLLIKQVQPGLLILPGK